MNDKETKDVEVYPLSLTTCMANKPGIREEMIIETMIKIIKETMIKIIAETMIKVIAETIAEIIAKTMIEIFE